MQIATSSIASRSNGPESTGLAFPESIKSSIQKADSSASSRTMPILEMKSGFDLARHAARQFAPTEVPERRSCRRNTRVVSSPGNFSQNLIISKANCLVRIRRLSCFIPALCTMHSTLCTQDVAHQLVQQSLQISVCLGQHQGDVPLFITGSWQTSNALALQASQCGSITHRLHQFIAGNSTKAQREASLTSPGGCNSHSRYQFQGNRSACRPVNPVSQNKVGSDELEHYQRFPPFSDS